MLVGPKSRLWVVDGLCGSWLPSIGYSFNPLEIGRDELLARAMKICLYPLVRLISGKTEQTITREDEGLAEGSWRQDCTLKGGVHALIVKEK